MANRERLLSRRIPVDEVQLGRAYVIHARNGGVGVAVNERGTLGYKLHRVKFGRHFLFTEYDWELDDNHGTAIPLKLIDELPPAQPPGDEGQQELLDWLAKQTEVHKDFIDATWEEVLGFKLPGRGSRRE